MAAIPVSADFLEDIRVQLTSTITTAGFMVSTGLNAERTAHLWFNIQLRRLRPQRRQVRWSDTLAGKSLSAAHQHVVEAIVLRSERGEDLAPFLSRRLKDPGYNDRLLNDWAAHHLHLGGTTPEADGFVPRSGELLYVYAQPDTLYLLDVLGHQDSFGDIQLVEIIHRNWPDIVARFKLGLRGDPHSAPSSAEIVQGRKMGLQPLIPLADGTIYGPFGGGISTCGLNSKIVRQAADLLSQARALENICRENVEQIHQGLEATTGRKLDRLVFGLLLTQTELIVVETQTNIGIRTAAATPCEPAAPQG